MNHKISLIDKSTNRVVTHCGLVGIKVHGEWPHCVMAYGADFKAIDDLDEVDCPQCIRSR